MKQLLIFIGLLTCCFSFAQDKEKQLALASQKANEYVYEANQLISSEDYETAEMSYRKAISEQPTNVAGVYNLGNSYYNSGKFDEALYRHQQAIKNAITKDEKHKAFHNIGNILMQSKKCKEAVEAFKNALRNNPSDNETRYNLGIAKECAKKQEEEQENEDKKDEEEKKDQQDEEQKEKEGDDKEEPKDEGDKEEKEGEDKEDEKGNPKDEKEEKGDQNKNEEQKQKPQPGQLSPQQIKNLLEAMNNQEQKVQEKINAEKTKGAKTQTEKDW